MIAALARLPIARLTRSPRAWLPVALWGAIALGFAAFARSRSSAHAADHVLLGAFGAVALPLLVYAIVSASLGGESLARAGTSLASFGAPPWRAAASAIVVASVASAIFGALVASGVAAIAHGASDPPVARDVVTSAWVGAAGGASYAAYFCFASSFGARGGGRSLLLVLDWVLGSGTGALALITPRAHLRNLLGGAPPLDLSQRKSLLALAVLFTVYGALATLRTRR